MPIPLALVLKVVVPIVTGIAGAAVAAAAARSNEESPVASMTKKRVLLVGPTDSGKTVLFDLLTRGISESPEIGDTRDTFEFDDLDATFDDVDLSVVDSPSTRFRANEMRTWVNQANVIAFVVDAALLLDDDYADNAERLAIKYRGLEDIDRASNLEWRMVLTHADYLDRRLDLDLYRSTVPSFDRLSKLLDDPTPPELHNLHDPASAQSAVTRILEAANA